MLFTLLIINENFPVLAIAARFMLGSPDDCEDVLCLLEDRVHFLKGAVSGLWIEEVDYRKDERITMEVVSF
jgi:hypothetical protein